MTRPVTSTKEKWQCTPRGLYSGKRPGTDLPSAHFPAVTRDQRSALPDPENRTFFWLPTTPVPFCKQPSKMTRSLNWTSEMRLFLYGHPSAMGLCPRTRPTTKRPCILEPSTDKPSKLRVMNNQSPFIHHSFNRSPVFRPKVNRTSLGVPSLN